MRLKRKLQPVFFTMALFVTLVTLTHNMASVPGITSSTGSTSPEVHMIALRKYYTPSKYTLISLNHAFILTNKHICKKVKPYLIIMVPSKESHFEERQALRETFTALSNDKISQVNNVSIDFITRVVFVIGKSMDADIEMKVYKENERNRDIVQIDMVDNYYNLTLKVLMALKWVNLYCPHAKYILKSDDDVFVHIGNLLDQIHSVEHSANGNIFGNLLNNSEEAQVNRGETKTSVTYDEYPIEILPPYSQGTSYTLTNDLVGKILKTAPYLPYLHLEDVFITGIIAGQIQSAKLVMLNKTSHWRDETPNPCWFVQTNQLAKSAMTPNAIRKTWNALMNPLRYCRNSTYVVQDKLKPET
ncbi:hypothetical protein ACF0H5_023880 [Mactra antiquata]